MLLDAGATIEDRDVRGQGSCLFFIIWIGFIFIYDFSLFYFLILGYYFQTN